MFVRPPPESFVMVRIKSRGAWALGSRPLASSGAAGAGVSFVSRGCANYLTFIGYSGFLLLPVPLLPAPRTPRQRSRGQHPFRDAPAVVTRLLWLCFVGL